MTCIVGLKSEGVVYIGGDSAATHGTVPKILAAGKVWRLGEIVMGGSGSARTNELIRYNFKPPRVRVKDGSPEALDRYMNTAFTSALRKLLADNGCVKKSEDEDAVSEDCGGSFLVGVRGELYLIDCSFAAYRVTDDINSTGSGHEVALGALHAIQARNGSLPPEEKLTIALEAAARWQDGVRPPFTIESTQRPVAPKRAPAKKKPKKR